MDRVFFRAHQEIRIMFRQGRPDEAAAAGTQTHGIHMISLFYVNVVAIPIVSGSIPDQVCCLQPNFWLSRSLVCVCACGMFIHAHETRFPGWGLANDDPRPTHACFFIMVNKVFTSSC